MKTLYLDCSMGAAGDMLAAALLECQPDRQKALDRLNAIGIPGVVFSAEPAKKCGIAGTRMRVTVDGKEEGDVCAPEHDHGAHDHTQENGQEHGHGAHDHAQYHEHGHEHDHGAHDHAPEHGPEHGQEAHGHAHEHEHGHAHRSLADVEGILSDLNVSDTVRQQVGEIYRLIAQAESAVHGTTVKEIHFHEVGALDAIADITAVCVLLESLDVDEIVASSVHVGSGHVHCAHGTLPVPAPATAHLLTGIPSYGGQIEGELCTPTGAALLKYFVHTFAPQPVMTVERIGIGCGKRDFKQANCLRAFLGTVPALASETVPSKTLCVAKNGAVPPKVAPTKKVTEPPFLGTDAASPNFAETAAGEKDTVVTLQCNLDDMTPEEVAFAAERLFDCGALDVFTTAIGMKKGRPGILLTCLCAMEKREEMVRQIFFYTTTLGVRETVCQRCTLSRSVKTVHTDLGDVRVKSAEGYGVSQQKAEYDDLAAIAKNKGWSISQARTYAAEKGEEKQKEK